MGKSLREMMLESADQLEREAKDISSKIDATDMDERVKQVAKQTLADPRYLAATTLRQAKTAIDRIPLIGL